MQLRWPTRTGGANKPAPSTGGPGSEPHDGRDQQLVSRADADAGPLRPVSQPEAPGENEACTPPLSRHADFNRLWLGQSVSSFGTQTSFLAMPLTAVLYLHADAAQLGLLGACERYAFIVPLLFIGVWVDRRRRRSLLWAHSLRMFVLYITVTLVGGLSALFGVAYGLHFQLLHRDRADHLRALRRARPGHVRGADRRRLWRLWRGRRARHDDRVARDAGCLRRAHSVQPVVVHPLPAAAASHPGAHRG